MRKANSGHRFRWRRLSPGSAETYVVATVLVVIAGLSRWALEFFVQDLQAFTTFYPAVLFAALLGGSGPGIFAVILGGIICWWEFLPRYTSLVIPSHADEINLVAYFIASFIIVWAIDHNRKLTKKIQDDEKFRKLAIDELAHRLKNKIATIQSIISFRLRGQPDVRDEIVRSLAALTATDDLITATQGQGAYLRAILSAEIAPYDASRISMTGPECLLSPKLALTMALLIHELATNAAKYGALSNSNGKLSINWTLSDLRLALSWRESGGPTVNPPSHSGFGTRLFLRALEQFDGDVDTDFAPTGLVCKLSVAVPEYTPDDIGDVSAKGSAVARI